MTTTHAHPPTSPTTTRAASARRRAGERSAGPPGDGSPARLERITRAIDDSPRMAAQRRLVQRMVGGPEEEERTAQAVQREEGSGGPVGAGPPAAAAADSSGGLPGPLRNGIEALSGVSMSDVRVHYGSSEPKQIGALAYAQGRDIHVSSGQEKHLPHEAWHVVQQAQGRVRPTMEVGGGVPVNDDARLEREADIMGRKALQMAADPRRRLPAGALRPDGD